MLAAAQSRTRPAQLNRQETSGTLAPQSEREAGLAALCHPGDGLGRLAVRLLRLDAPVVSGGADPARAGADRNATFAFARREPGLDRGRRIVFRLAGRPLGPQTGS